MAKGSLGVMSFNVWRNGGRSLDATIEAIQKAGADVVGLQECNGKTADAIADALDFGLASDDASLAVLSRFDIVEDLGRTAAEWGGLGVVVDVDGTRVAVFDAHLHWERFGPYLFHDGAAAAEVLAEEERLRMPGLRELLDLVKQERRALLVGDFNAPSHLDDPRVPWPTSLACEAAGLVDAWHALHRGVAGHTWSPIPEEEVRGVHGRIDFVYATPNLVPVRAEVLDGERGPNPWPSDHRAVVAAFDLRSDVLDP